ncbi:MAG TPA: hypothetical protein VMU49_10075 [Candidatus Acidoferrales bacterium]|nr:hypothetical protein [Candidatus Acidoferrales bacterium]
MRGRQVPSSVQRRRRSTRPSLADLTGAIAARRARLSSFARAYLAVGVLLAVLIAYLVVSAQVTKSAYQLSMLRQQNQQLLSQEAQLQYQEAALHTPARVAQEAAQSSLVQTAPAQFVAGPPLAVNLAAPIGPSRARPGLLWQKALAAIFSITGHDALAADLTH